jgi:iron complex transport system substrate-binding protein
MIPTVAVCLAGALLCCGGSGGEQPRPGEFRRIVSLAPNITETLFALGCGDRVVGVTDYCRYPPEATAKPRVGGYFNPNLEALFGLSPDLVILMREHGGLIETLKSRGIAYLAVDNRSMESILRSIDLVAKACGVAARGDSIVQAVRGQMEPLGAPARQPSVLVCVGRDGVGSGSIHEAFFAGPRTFYNDILVATGARNALADSVIAYPSVSAEAVLRLAPDIIVDLAAAGSTVDRSDLAADWSAFSSVPAVAGGRVHCLTEDYMTVPGPRIVLIVKVFRQIAQAWRDGVRGEGPEAPFAGGSPPSPF